MADFPISNIVIDRTFEGSLLLTWTEETVGTKIVIVKRIRDYPYIMTDGTEIYRGPATWGMLEDKNVVDSTWYYYQFYYWDEGDTLWKTDVTLRSFGLAIEHQEGFRDILRKTLPNMYYQKEVEESPDEPLKWQFIRDEVIRIFFEEFAGLIRAFPVNFDVDRCPGHVLEGHARMVGITPNYELTYSRQREEIKAAVDIWKTKGTPESIRKAINAVTGLPTIIDEWIDNIIVTNWVDRPVFDFHDTNQVDNYREVGHITCHVLDFNTVEYDRWYNTFSFGIFIYFDDETRELTQEAVRKVRRIVKDYVPVFQKPHLYFIAETEHEEDPYPYYPITDSHKDELHDRYLEEGDDVYTLLYTGQLDLISNKFKIRSATSYTADYVIDTWKDEISHSP